MFRLFINIVQPKKLVFFKQLTIEDAFQILIRRDRFLLYHKGLNIYQTPLTPLLFFIALPADDFLEKK